MNPPIDLSASAGSKQEGSIALSKEEDALMKQQLAYAQGLQFPWRLHVLLEITQKRGQGHIISWLPKGKSFRVHDKREFSVQIMPTFFCSSIYKTFQRNLTLWGFHTASKGIDKGMCTHDFFIRGKPELCSLMKRVRIKSCKKAQQNSDPDASKSKSGDADLRGESKKSAAPTTVSRGHQDNSMKTYTSKPSAYEDLFCPQLPTGIGMVPNSAIARVSNQASNPTIRTCASLDPNPFRNNSIRRPAPNPALPVPHALQENLQSMSVQLLQEMAARFSGNTSLTSGATQQHSRLMQTASLLSRADVFSRHVQQAQQQQQQQQQQALVLQGQQQSPVDFLSVGDMGITANPRPRPFHQATPSTTNAAPVSVPETVGRRISCRARAMPVDHNPNTAHYTIQVDFTKHGSELFCSHEQCRNEGIKFLYCAYCKVPVAKKSFYSRHRHDEEEGKKPELKGEKREEMKVAAPNEAKFPAQPDESGVPLQVTLTRTKSDKKKKKKRKSRSASKREQRCGSSDKKRKTTSHSSSSESSSASSRSSLSREASSANMNAEGKTDRAGPAAAASDTPYEQFRNTPVLKNWENLLFHRPPTEAADQMSEWLMGVLSVSANFRELVDTGLATTTTPRSEGNGQAHPSGNDNGRNCSSSESYSSGSNSDDCAK